MRKSVRQIVDDIKTDRELAPYFVDYIGENLKMNFEKLLCLDETSGKNFLEGANSKLSILLNQLESKVPKKHKDVVLEEVCRYYAGMMWLSF